MPEQNADLVRRVYETWNSEGLDTIAPWLAESVELQDAPELPDSGTSRGAGCPAFGEVFHVVRVDGDRIACLRVFLGEAAALAAANA